MNHLTAVALTKFLSDAARKLGVAEHVYIVGGAPRNFLMDPSGTKFPVKDLDVVVDSIALAGKDAAWFSKALSRQIPTSTSLVVNQYGVAILTVKGDWIVGDDNLKGEVIEIATARKEHYGEAAGKGYKPHMVEPATIQEDALRRDATFNTLMWRLLDLEHGPDRAEVLDMTGRGLKDLADRRVQTPLDPDRTFSDDPTRLLRVVKFVAKYNFTIPVDLAKSIRRNAPRLAQMPWDAVRKILTDDILNAPNPRRSIRLLKDLGLADVLRDMLQKEPGFASAVSRSLSDAEALVLFDIVDLGWIVKTPLWFLDKAGQERVVQILMSSDGPTGKAFVEALKKPPIDQMALFTKYEIPPKDRQVVTQLAREQLLGDPRLVQNPTHLNAQVEEVLARRRRSLRRSTADTWVSIRKGSSGWHRPFPQKSRPLSRRVPKRRVNSST